MDITDFMRCDLELLRLRHLAPSLTYASFATLYDFRGADVNLDSVKYVLDEGWLTRREFLRQARAPFVNLVLAEFCGAGRGRCLDLMHRADAILRVPTSSACAWLACVADGLSVAELGDVWRANAGWRDLIASVLGHELDALGFALRAAKELEGDSSMAACDIVCMLAILRTPATAPRRSALAFHVFRGGGVGAKVEFMRADRAFVRRASADPNRRGGKLALREWRPS